MLTTLTSAPQILSGVNVNVNAQKILLQNYYDIGKICDVSQISNAAKFLNKGRLKIKKNWKLERGPQNVIALYFSKKKKLLFLLYA